jgi:hypothetical protein
VLQPFAELELGAAQERADDDRVDEGEQPVCNEAAAKGSAMSARGTYFCFGEARYAPVADEVAVDTLQDGREADLGADGALEDEVPEVLRGRVWGSCCCGDRGGHVEGGS